MCPRTSGTALAATAPTVCTKVVHRSTHLAHQPFLRDSLRNSLWMDGTSGTTAAVTMNREGRRDHNMQMTTEPRCKMYQNQGRNFMNTNQVNRPSPASSGFIHITKGVVCVAHVQVVPLSLTTHHSLGSATTPLTHRQHQPVSHAARRLCCCKGLLCCGDGGIV
jgi:hypothetical protein